MPEVILIGNDGTPRVIRTPTGTTALGSGTVPVGNLQPSIQAPSGGANFVAGPQGVQSRLPIAPGRGLIPAPQAGLPSVINAPPAQLPALGPQNFTLGPEGPLQGPNKALEPKLLEYKPQGGGGAVPPKTPPASLFGKVGQFARGAAPAALATLPFAFGEEVPRDQRVVVDGIIPDPFEVGAMGAQALHDLGTQLTDAQGNPRSRAATDFAFGLLGNTLKAPAELGQFLKTKGKDVGDVAIEPFLTNEELERKRQDQQETLVNDIANSPEMQQFRLEEEQRAQKLALSLGNKQRGSAGSFIDGGSVFLPQEAPELPPPPPGPDFSEVYESLAQTMPEPPVDKDGAETLAILAGMASGVLGTSDKDLGTQLLAAGVGGLAGQGSHQKQKLDAEKDFKRRLQDYHARVAVVKRAEAESAASYAKRVWQFKVDNLMNDYKVQQERRASMQSRISQAGNGFFITEFEDNGDGTAQRKIKFYNPKAETDRLASMQKRFKTLVGEDEANTIIMSLAQGDSTRGAAKWVLAKAKAEGKYEALIAKLGGDNLTKAISQAGARVNTFAGGTESAKNEIIDNERDAILIEMMMSSPRIMQDSASIVGLGDQVFSLRQGVNPFEIR